MIFGEITNIDKAYEAYRDGLIQPTCYDNIVNYKGYSITKEEGGRYGSYFAVFCEGEELYFESLEEAMGFIDEAVAK